MWASPVTQTQTRIAKVMWEGDAHITRVLGMGMPKRWGRPYHCNIAIRSEKETGSSLLSQRLLETLLRNQSWPIADRRVPCNDPTSLWESQLGPVSFSLLKWQMRFHDQRQITNPGSYLCRPRHVSTAAVLTDRWHVPSKTAVGTAWNRASEAGNICPRYLFCAAALYSSTSGPYSAGPATTVHYKPSISGPTVLRMLV